MCSVYRTGIYTDGTEATVRESADVLFKCKGCLGGKTCMFELQAELVTFFNRMLFSLQRMNDMQAMVIQTFSQKQMKLACHFKENKWQDLLPIIKLELSSEN